MIKVSLAWVANAVNGTLSTQSVQDMTINSVSTDTRTLKPGDLFIALTGENFNGHEYILKALEKGASAVIVSQLVDCPLPTIKVKDTRQALGMLGGAVRDKVNPKTIGITGSSGKTTVKEMVASILSQKGKVLATQGNFNNDIGVPLTLLALNESHEYAVIEMGANHQGEIDYTTMLAKPDVATIVNAAPSHLQGFGSLFGVARAKSEIFKGLDDAGVAILNADSQFYEFWQGKTGSHKVFSYAPVAETGDYHAINKSLNAEGCGEFELVTPESKVAIRLRVPGEHNIGNAVLAAALSMQVGASQEDVQKGLFAMRNVAGRLNQKSINRNLQVIDDTYNANVASVKAAIDLLVNFSGPRIFVFGDMGELGDQTLDYHQQIGQYAKEKGVDAMLTLGQFSEAASAVMAETGKHCVDVEDAMNQVSSLIDAAVQANRVPVTVLVKGSRSAKMERVVAAIEHHYSHQSTQESGQC
ncbi:UDP-N-acetylmuramoyl-tripeptide--D-alanyl-D-alanine ligase [Glaciecola sp. XM2]|uniref:UDP-N-acetylmuramoyl-tripeptide--D-alanyl-D- alanine ligase n=1 Tax=Glaciecola sp. XM2 TaxID=1914931 RepID=UPI001BDE8B7B|nr:UDP-N-acetylmuramoyl-tripeptide--D-alanyl-D-alanine ligase [Glaciecola sp. XM2]MBT1450508.1 UDP-N-acetylmuramoyl-tripeptide--D-alanyl-D-alanine ligase [Glaciecola sp. XM2]